MNRSILVCAFVVAAAASLAAQQAGQTDPYQGVSTPPPNDTIISDSPADTTPAPPAKVSKPSPSHYAAPVQQTVQQPTAQTQAETPDVVRIEEQPQYPSTNQSASISPADGTDGGIVQVAPDPPPGPSLKQRIASDPDGDIVHPAPLGPNELGEGTTIRARLLNEVSTNFSEDGTPFRARVMTDVLQDGRILIPAGSEIDGRVTNVSSGSFGGHGSLHLTPDFVILPDGSRYRMFAQVIATPGSSTRVGSEGSINPGSQVKRNSIEYGGAVGAGAVTGAALGGPAGALAGSLVGAGVITAHLLLSHPQATLDQGTYLQFMLTERLNLVPAGLNGN
ncbi:MAG TPA: hypothetical protein VF730_07965 [Terracidiphilus sp.]